MKYEIRGGTFPVLVCNLSEEESIISLDRKISWMSPNMDITNATTNGLRENQAPLFEIEPIKQKLCRAIGGFGTIAFPVRFPGEIIHMELDGTQDYICQRCNFIAATDGIELTVHSLDRNIDASFGNDGFILERVSGVGIAFLEINGSAIKYNLHDGQQIVIDPQTLVAAGYSCTITTKTTSKPMNDVEEGQQGYKTVITGPGKVILQTMPFNHFAKDFEAISK